MTMPHHDLQCRLKYLVSSRYVVDRRWCIVSTQRTRCSSGAFRCAAKPEVPQILLHEGLHHVIVVPMSEEAPGRWRWLLPLVVGLCSGGLAGAVFTYWINRPKPTVINYRVVTTTLAAPEASGLVPGLKILIGSEPTTALYAHSVDLVAQQGPFLDSVEFALTFPSPVRVYASPKLEKPTSLHSLDCSPINPQPPVPPTGTQFVTQGFKCRMSPVKVGSGHFLITIPSSDEHAPKVDVVAKGVEITTLDSPGAQDNVTWLLLKVQVPYGQES